MKNSARKLGQAGFTLIEILVALILISLLVAAVFPVVTQQAGQADAPRLANDLTNVRSGIELFNVNLRNRFPANLGQLTTSITTSDEALGELAYNSSHVSRWDGPYIDAAGGNDIVSGYDAIIDKDLALYLSTADHSGTAPLLLSSSGASADFVALAVSGLDASGFTRLNDLIDGESDTSASSGFVGGKLRALSSSPATAFYLAVPFRQ
jgi:prepilin-type N-terminal cleavage/methylation domain-containing protein